MKKGFTLIELLAVIVILAIISLIAVPIVLNIISDSTKNSEKENIKLYVDMVQKTITAKNLKTKYSPKACYIQENGQIKCNSDINNNLEILEISVHGEKPSAGTMVVENGKITNIFNLVLNNKKYDYDSTRKEKILEIPEQAGLYDKNYKLLASWEELINYGLDVSNGELHQGIKDIIENNSNFVDARILIISSNVTKIGSFAFSNCSQLTNIIIPNSVTSIGYESFIKCSSLEFIEIPSSVTSIYVGSFAGCESLKSLKVDSGNTVYEDRSSNSIIKKSNNTLLVGCLNTIIPENVTKIESKAFSGRKKIKSILIPSNVKTIGSQAFSGCTGLTSIILSSGLKTISNHAFYYCYNLIDVVIPNTVTSMGGSVFQDCWKLSRIKLSSSLTSIESYTFRDCGKLSSIIIPSNVVNIKSNAFYGCRELNKAIFENTEGWYIYDTNTETTGTEIDVTNESINSINLRKTYINKYWKRN